MSELISSKIVKTRKPHFCFGCAREFPKETKMQYNTVKDDEIFNTYICSTCLEVMNNMEYGDEFCYGDLREDALELEASKGKETNA